MASAASSVAIRPMRADRSDLERFRDCFSRNGSPRTIEHLTWQYVDNPTGRVFVDLAIPVAAPETIGAIYASLPVFARVSGDVRLALQSLDTLTDVEFRGQGLFVKLARSLFARAASDGVAFIYGFPNGNSAHGFFRRLEWHSLDPLPFLVRPLRSAYIVDRLDLVKRLGRGSAIAGLLPNVALPIGPRLLSDGVRIVEVTAFDDRFTELWREVAAGDVVGVERDAAYLTWRLLQKPDGQYRVLAAFRGENLVGWTAFCVREKHGGRIGYVMELMHRKGRTRDARALVVAVLRGMREEGADVALAFSFAHACGRRAYDLSGFVPLPERLRPIELHFGVRAFDRTVALQLEHRANWHVSYLDSDTV